MATDEDETTEDSHRKLSATEELVERRRRRAPPTGPQVVPGSPIGRYEVVEELGAGTMGVVYAAHDPELDRKVAIKVLKSRSEDQAASRARLQREAQALAKLRHRNVVGIYDVGVHDGQLSLVMEFVEGQTLRSWLEAKPRTWPEILEVMSEAGRGLVAAHGAGFVHRDFKPDNVMINVNGRVKVMDFGLARAEIHEPRSQDVPPGASVALETLTEIPTLAGPLTATGTVMGTPGYMSRELFRGLPADARSDQFAFCVSLYEALYGERPFPGRNMAQLLGAVAEGAISDPPEGSKIPTWLRRIVVRGLAGEPDHRWPSVQALLEALADGPRRARRRKLAIAGGIAAGLWIVAGTILIVRDVQACRGLEAEADAIWNEDRRVAIEAKFEASKVSYAADAWQRVERGLDGYVAQWLKARTMVCTAARREELPEMEARLRATCLDAGLQHLRATVDLLAEADPAIVGRAVEMVAELPRLERCEDIETLARNADPMLSLSESERITELEQRLAEAEALEKAGKYELGLATVGEVLSQASQGGHTRVLARAHLRQGILLRRAGRYVEAVETLVRAYELSLGRRMHAEAAEASATLVFIVGYQLAQYDEGRRWALDAKPLARAAGTDEAEALYLNNIGALAYGEAKFAEARGYWNQAYVLRERALGSSHPSVAGSLNNLGVVAHAEGRFDEARDFHERALGIWTEALGPEHPQTSYSLNHLGKVAREQGRYDDALRLHESALAIRERALGLRHTLVADTLLSLGRLFEAKQDHRRALDYHQRALGVYETALGAEHPSVATVLIEMGQAYVALERSPEAIVALERALAILDRKPGDPIAPARARFALARAVEGQGRAGRVRARALAEQARVGFEQAGPKAARELAEVEAWLE